jgi:hypothetical protein
VSLSLTEEVKTNPDPEVIPRGWKILSFTADWYTQVESGESFVQFWDFFNAA